MLSGHLAMFVDRGAGLHKMMEWRQGDITGMLPVLAAGQPAGRFRRAGTDEILSVHRDHLHEMIRECHEITSILVHTMLDRARVFTSSDLHDEKMVSLGKLSAGLAHELNNPASAIERSAALLEERLDGYRAGDARARRVQADRGATRRRRRVSRRVPGRRASRRAVPY